MGKSVRRNRNTYDRMKGLKMEKANSNLWYKENTFIVAIVVATTFLPSTNQFNILKMVIVFLLLLILNQGFMVNKIFVFWSFNILLATLAVILYERNIVANTIVHEGVRVIYYAMIVTLCMRLKLSLKNLYIICVFVVCIHFSIQMTQFLDLGVFNSFIEQYYLAGDANNLHYVQAINDSYSFRSGSIFINPNVYVCYPYLSTGVFLQYYKTKNKYTPLFMAVIAFCSIVLTGSRMGIITYACIILLFLLIEGKQQRGVTKFQIVIVLLVVIAIINWNSLFPMISDMRAFELYDGTYEGSFSVKVQGVLSYLLLSNPLYWIVGSLGSSTTNFAIDMELGYIFAWFGCMGFYWYIKLLKTLYKWHCKDFEIISKVTLFSVVLTGLAASSVLNMSVFPYICVIALTRLYE